MTLDERYQVVQSNNFALFIYHSVTQCVRLERSRLFESYKSIAGKWILNIILLIACINVHQGSDSVSHIKHECDGMNFMMLYWISKKFYRKMYAVSFQVNGYAANITVHTVQYLFIIVWYERRSNVQYWTCLQFDTVLF